VKFPISGDVRATHRDDDLRNKQGDDVHVSLVCQTGVLVPRGRAIHLNFGILACINDCSIYIWSVTKCGSSQENVVIVKHDFLSLF
jgi:hypothetical protein